MVQAIKFATKLGYRSFDLGWIYFVESLAGCTLNELISEQRLSRGELFLGSKVWNTFHREDILPIGLNDTLTNLKTDYLDLYLLHWPIAFKDNPGYDPYPLDTNGKLMFSDTHYLEAYHV
jgi:diketogulonate reductase-like aldo/keto reductase